MAKGKSNFLLRKELNMLLKFTNRVFHMVQRMEWCRPSLFGMRCPICGGLKRKGHFMGCELKALILIGGKVPDERPGNQND